MAALGQWEQLVVKTHGPSYQDEVIGYSPCDSLSVVGRCGSLISIILFVDIWRADGHTCLDPNATVEAGEPHPIAKGMGEDTCVDIAGAHENESSEEAEQ